jgi:hypothetical protein
LSNLIGFRFRAFPLKVDAFHHAKAGENVMTAGNPHPKTFRLKQVAKLIEASVRIGISPQQLF